METLPVTPEKIEWVYQVMKNSILTIDSSVPAYEAAKMMEDMTTQTTQEELTSTTSLAWNARQRKIVILSFLVTGLGTVLILGLGTLLGN